MKPRPEASLRSAASDLAAPHRPFIGWFDAASEHLNEWSGLKFNATCVTVTLSVSVAFFAPKLWLMTYPRPGTFEWDRALSFLRQCQTPFDDNVEGAMQWRLLPPLVAHSLGMTGYSALAIPFIGVAALLSYWCRTTERLLGDRLSAALGTVIVGTTAALLSITTLYGVNDAWFLIGLLAIAAGTGWPSLVTSGLLCPWVDERFILGWAAAMFCRSWLNRPAPFRTDFLVGLAALVPYLAIRGGYSLCVADRGSAHFVTSALAIVPTYLPYARFGWWMGFRVAWVLIAVAGYDLWLRGSRSERILGLGSVVAGWIAVTLLAADLSRSTNLILPVLLCGIVALKRHCREAQTVRYWMAGIAIANVILPFATVTFNKVVPVWGLPIELVRLARG